MPIVAEKDAASSSALKELKEQISKLCIECTFETRWVVIFVFIRTLIAIIMAASFSVGVSAESTQDAFFDELTRLNNRIAQLEVQRDHYGYLLVEAERMREDATKQLVWYVERLDQERANFIGLLKLSLTFAGISISAGVWFLGRSFLTTRKELQSWAQEEVSETVERLQKAAETTIQEQFGTVLHDMGSELESLKQALEREVRYRSARVAFVADRDEVETLDRTEAVAIRERGLSVTSFEVSEAFENDSFKLMDLIVYHYGQKEDREAALEAFLNKLESEFRDGQVKRPVIIYTKGYVDLKAVEDYGMATFANSLPALVGHVLVQAFFLSRTVARETTT